jgi:monovalent cation:H+ antiporter, CPA1 family
MKRLRSGYDIQVHSDSTAYGLQLLMVLLLVASAVGLAVRWVKVPYSIALVIVGLALGSSHVLPRIEMHPDILLLVFLPALLFEASWNLDAHELKANWRPIALLAGPGVIVSMLVSGFVVHYFGGIDFRYACLFGAMVAATDPISVLSIIRKLGCDKRLSLLLEAESLFNDGTAVVLFKIMLTLVLASITITNTPPGVGNYYGDVGNMGVDFCIAVVGGGIVGLAVGYLGSEVTRFFDDHLLEITLTTIVAYGSYLIAEQFHVSPVIAVLVAGIVVGNYGSREHMSAATRLAVNAFWEYAAFVVNSLVFLLIGLQIDLPLLAKYGKIISFGVLGILLARFIIVYVFGALLSSKTSPVPLNWRHLLFWGGLRGSLSMAMALSLPRQLGAEKEELTVLTFGVVLFTLLLPGLTSESLVNALKLSVADPLLREYESLRSRLYAETQALHALKNMFESGAVNRKVYDQLLEEIAARCEHLGALMDDLHLNDASAEAVQLATTRKQLLDVRKDALRQLLRQHGAERDIVENLVLEVDSSLEEVVNNRTSKNDPS